MYKKVQYWLRNYSRIYLPNGCSEISPINGVVSYSVAGIVFGDVRRISILDKDMFYFPFDVKLEDVIEKIWEAYYRVKSTTAEKNEFVRQPSTGIRPKKEKISHKEKIHGKFSWKKR